MGTAKESSLLTAFQSVGKSASWRIVFKNSMELEHNFSKNLCRLYICSHSCLFVFGKFFKVARVASPHDGEGGGWSAHGQIKVIIKHPERKTEVHLVTFLSPFSPGGAQEGKELNLFQAAWGFSYCEWQKQLWKSVPVWAYTSSTRGKWVKAKYTYV